MQFCATKGLTELSLSKNQSMIKIKFYSLIRIFLKLSEIDLEIQDLSILDLLKETEKKIDKKFLFKLIDEKGELKQGTMILINGRNIFHLQKLDSIVLDGDKVSIFPPGGGG
ncbi:MAG TPA: molybdopterin synthase sulfur carrier subunit [Candidatus Cloacimonetes bacterium]|nr:molybdopterin synthase sulfur carrier subunit [Candidatus Cloacimonadota bacterium]